MAKKRPQESPEPKVSMGIEYLPPSTPAIDRIVGEACARLGDFDGQPNAPENSKSQSPRPSKKIDFLAAYKTLFSAHMRGKGRKVEVEQHPTEDDFQSKTDSSKEQSTTSA